MRIMKKNLIILNPCSGKKKANKYLTQIVDVFTHAGYMSTVADDDAAWRRYPLRRKIRRASMI